MKPRNEKTLCRVGVRDIRKPILALFAATVIAVTLLVSPRVSADSASDAQEWRFRVYLDDKEIGTHEFYLKQQGPERILHSTADFEYKLLFVKLYEYQHENSEVWQGNCLKQIESSTDANGKPFAVSGQREEQHFVVQNNRGESALPPCIMSFAYWNPEFLLQTHLLNSQNGEFLPVNVSPAVFDPLEVRGETQNAWRYELLAGELQLELWYSEDHRWLGLASQAEGGRTLRYELL